MLDAKVNYCPAIIGQLLQDLISTLVILFDALTEFLKKQALKGANELINYYSKKYKKEFKHYGGHKGAHVVGHYADGARLVGLTENELYTQLKGLKQQSNLSK